LEGNATREAGSGVSLVAIDGAARATSAGFSDIPECSDHFWQKSCAPYAKNEEQVPVALR
jgi:hypothetical protein